VSRAHWLAFGSALAAMGCSGGRSSVSGSELTAGGEPDANANNTFVCNPDMSQSYLDSGTLLCDRTTQFCSLLPSPVRGCLSEVDNPGTFPVECRSDRTCACVNQHERANCYCVDLDDAGAIGLSCGGCYGSPPARLERLRRVRRTRRRRATA
jgi:hypothetical protein